jgi:hypothetical protein
MEVVEATQINTFGSKPPKADFVPPSEESVFILSASQLQEIIRQATAPILHELQDLKDQRAQDRAEFERFKATHKTFAVQANKDIDALFDATAKATTTPTTQPKGEKTIARLAKIEEVLKTRGPSTLKELERILGIDKATMTRLLGKLDMRRYELHSRPGDDREKVLRLKVQIR